MARPPQALLNETFYMEEYIQPIASFDYLSRVGTFDRPRSGKSHTLIALSDHWYDWETFAQLARIDMPRNYQLMVFSDYAVALQAALNGQGIALGWLSVASRLLASRSLQAASSAYINTGATYSFLSPNENSLSPIVASVRKWMIVQSEPDLEKIRKDARLHSMPHKIALPGAGSVARGNTPSEEGQLNHAASLDLLVHSYDLLTVAAAQTFPCLELALRERLGSQFVGRLDKKGKGETSFYARRVAQNRKGPESDLGRRKRGESSAKHVRPWHRRGSESANVPHSLPIGHLNCRGAFREHILLPRANRKLIASRHFPAPSPRPILKMRER